MALTTTDQQFIEAEPALPEPHFDEEATLLSARRVVPLSVIEATGAKAWFPHPWILGLGLIGALMIGVLATAIYYSRSKDTGSTVFQDGVMAGVEGKSSEPLNSFSGPAADQPTVESAAPAEVQNTVARRSTGTSAEPGTKPRARLVDVIRNRKGNQPEEESLEDRRAARRQARQERRRADRQRDSRTSDELLRIRDIFEGSPRPQE